MSHEYQRAGHEYQRDGHEYQRDGHEYQRAGQELSASYDSHVQGGYEEISPYGGYGGSSYSPGKSNLAMLALYGVAVVVAGVGIGGFLGPPSTSTSMVTQTRMMNMPMPVPMPVMMNMPPTVGGVGSKCTVNNECLSKICLAQVCVDDCKTQGLCLAGHPCTADKDCKKTVLTQNTCQDMKCQPCQVKKTSAGSPPNLVIVGSCKLGATCKAGENTCYLSNCQDGLCKGVCDVPDNPTVNTKDGTSTNGYEIVKMNTQFVSIGDSEYKELCVLTGNLNNQCGNLITKVGNDKIKVNFDTKRCLTVLEQKKDGKYICYIIKPNGKSIKYKEMTGTNFSLDQCRSSFFPNA